MAKSSKQPAAKPPGKCIFCGCGNLTKEHFFGKWSAPYLPRINLYTSHATSMSQFFVEPHYESGPGKLHGPGDPYSRQMRVVCKDCNEGWMKKLQDKAKLILVPLIQGEWNEIDADDQAILAKWATMFTMVLEHANPATLATPASQRQELKNGSVPEGWCVWIAPFQGEKWHGVSNHFGWAAHSLAEIFNLIGKSPVKCNAQSTAVVLGKLFLMTYSDTINGPKFNPRAFTHNYGLQQIWPVLNDLFKQTARELDDYSADATSAALSPPGYKRHAWETFQES